MIRANTNLCQWMDESINLSIKQSVYLNNVTTVIFSGAPIYKFAVIFVYGCNRSGTFMWRYRRPTDGDIVIATIIWKQTKVDLFDPSPSAITDGYIVIGLDTTP